MGDVHSYTKVLNRGQKYSGGFGERDGTRLKPCARVGEFVQRFLNFLFQLDWTLQSDFARCYSD